MVYKRVGFRLHTYKNARLVFLDFFFILEPCFQKYHYRAPKTVSMWMQGRQYKKKNIFTKRDSHADESLTISVIALINFNVVALL